MTQNDERRLLLNRANGRSGEQAAPSAAGMDQRTLLVLRHTKTEDTRPGSKDSKRRLTPDGERAALEVGDYLRTQGIAVDTVLCSSAARARQTLELLKLDDKQASGQVDVADRFYNAGTDTLIE